MYKIMLADEEKKILGSLESVMEKLEKAEPVMENGLICCILFQKYAVEELKYYKEFLGIASEFGYMFVLACSDGREGSHRINAGEENDINIQGQYAEIRKCVKEHFNCVMGNVIAGKIAVLNPCGRERMGQQEHFSFMESIRCLIRKIRNQTGIGFRIGIGTPKDFDKMRESYLEAVRALAGSGDTVVHAEDVPQHSGSVAAGAGKRDGTVMEKAREYICKNYRRDLSLEEVARMVNTSPYYFSRIFKEETGKNFVEYLTGVRMERAKELLKEGRCSIKEICCMTGYSEPNYFSRTFKKNVGITPTEYSRKFSKNIRTALL